MTRMLALAVTLLFATAAHAGVNKCKDKNGTVVYSEQPCDQAGAARIKELSKADLKGTDVHAKVPPPPAPGELAPLPVPPVPPGTKPKPDRD